jgi:shikimate dehydrogenase
VYLPLPAVDADDFLAFGRAIGISGASVTIPHKVSLFERVDEVDAIARRVGAINTIPRPRWQVGWRATRTSRVSQSSLNHVALDGRAPRSSVRGAARGVALRWRRADAR